jgi:branched-chain amino acid transport system permease protein
LSDAAFVVLAAIGVVGLNILTGYTGQISLGHAFFLAIGAYTAVVLGGHDHLAAYVWLPAAGVVAAIFGLLVGPTALRLRGLYLAIVTLGLVYIGLYAFPNMTAVTGGAGGGPVPPLSFGAGLKLTPDVNFQLLGHSFGQAGAYYFIALFILWLAVGFTYNVQRTRVGRAFQAVRDRELAATIMGIDLARTKVAAFATSSFLAGISGALFASLVSFVEPGQWDLLTSIQYLAAIIIGGMGTVFGPVLGAIVVFALPNVIGTLPFVSSGGGGISSADLDSIIYGVLIMIFVVVEPHGLVGLGKRVARQRPARGLREPAAGSADTATT